MSPTGCNPNWDSIILRRLFASCSNWSKTGKNEKIPVKTVITFLFLLFFSKKIRRAHRACVAVISPSWQPKTDASSLFNSQSKMSNLSFTSQKIFLPVFYLFIRYIEGRRYLAACYPTYFRVTMRLQHLPCLNSYSFLSF